MKKPKPRKPVVKAKDVAPPPKIASSVIAPPKKRNFFVESVQDFRWHQYRHRYAGSFVPHLA